MDSSFEAEFCGNFWFEKTFGEYAERSFYEFKLTPTPSSEALSTRNMVVIKAW